MTELEKNLYLLIREHVCRNVCNGGTHCKNQNCINKFFEIAEEIERKSKNESYTKA